MKNFRSLKNLVLLGVAVLLAAGCSKSNNEPAPAVSTLAVYHVSPDGPKVVFKLNSSVLSTDSVPYGTYGFYFNAYSGMREINAYQREIKMAALNADLKDGAIYSAWLTGAWANREIVLIEDKLVAASSGKALVRFVNMSVNSPALDLVTNTGTAVVSNKTYKTASDFVEVTGGQNYNFVIRENGSTTDKFLLPSVTIQTGRIYTIVARGFYAGSGATALTGDVLVNY